MTWRVCEHCGRRYINPGGHWEECPGAPPALSERVTTRGRVDSHTASPRSESAGPQLELVPDRRIDPRRGQVTRTPGIDAVCEAGKTADTCLWPFCKCKFPDRT